MPEPSPNGRRRTLIAVALGGIVALGAGLAVGLSDSDDQGSLGNPLGSPTSTFSIEAVNPRNPLDLQEAPGEPSPDDGSSQPTEDELGLEEEGPSGPPPRSDDERAAARAVRDYVNALTGRNGGAVCDSFAPGALDEVDFPVERDGCAATVAASLGYERKGMPVWKSSETTPSISAKLDGDEARVTATVVTLYKDQREPTIEDDIAFLHRAGDGWLIVKPDATLYRAIGNADVPLSAFTAP